MSRPLVSEVGAISLPRADEADGPTCSPTQGTSVFNHTLKMLRPLSLTSSPCQILITPLPSHNRLAVLLQIMVLGLRDPHWSSMVRRLTTTAVINAMTRSGTDERSRSLGMEPVV
ncbi:hypothetical protein EVAR_87926_1 [Eumeta japonica]|uniref:Uncharacterized protein n=1 Tax=Eumeta variegata TaxID=151549 RepID=A0A4C1WU58_EUMVA|nr:hypothetical protein EVAR_87926_1 [Eumeta japonica]